MIVRFQTEGHAPADFELIGAQAESTVGLFDAIRSGILDVTADAVVLQVSTAASSAALAKAGKSEKYSALVAQFEAAKAFTVQPVTVHLIPEAKAKPVLFLTFAEGLGQTALALAAETAHFMSSIFQALRPTAAALDVLDGLDNEAGAPLPEPEEAVLVDGEAIDADDLLSPEEAAEASAPETEKAKGGKRKKA